MRKAFARQELHIIVWKEVLS